MRHRLTKAGALLESQWAWVEQFVYQMTKLKKEGGRATRRADGHGESTGWDCAG